MKSPEGEPVVVCHCRVVTCRQIAGAVESGSRTLAQVCQSTGAAQECGHCVFGVKRVVGEQLERVDGDVELSA